MLAREDGLKVPVGIIPNGSGNALSSGLGMRDTQIALEAIAGRSVSKVDIWKCLIDTEDEDSIPRGKSSYNQKRYAILSFGVGAGLVMSEEWARPYKPYFGTKAYDIGKFKCWFKGLYEMFDLDIEVDGKKLITPGHEGLWTNLMFQFNANKISDRPVSFSSVVNHSCFDIIYVKNPDCLKA
jgi:diacylglycerol kinase family enzyme